MFFFAAGVFSYLSFFSRGSCIFSLFRRGRDHKLVRSDLFMTHVFEVLWMSNCVLCIPTS